MKRALICGAFGQDGSYLAELLVSKGYRVFGTTRDPQRCVGNATAMACVDKIEVMAMDVTDQASVLAAVVRTEPDEIYHLAGQSSVSLSFERPVETLNSIVTGALHILEAMRHAAPGARLYNASSSECFGTLGTDTPATERTPFHPKSPYGIAKAAAHMLVGNYREAYGLFAVSGLLFNHESPRRPAHFVTKKIVEAAYRIAHGSDETLRLGRIDVVRDWGWAPEYVEAMWRMLQHDRAEDLIIATGCSVPLSDFVAAAFAYHDLDWQRHTISDAGHHRPSDLDWSGADPSLAADRLGWRARIRMPEVTYMMASAYEVRERTDV